MTTQIQRRRGTTAQHSTFTGANGELTVDTDKEVVVVHDGTTAGGYPQMRENGSNSALALGSATTPSLKFSGDTNTGIYSPGADQVSVATGGSERLRIDAAGQIEAAGLGTAAAPAYSWVGDPNTGIYSPGADQVAISTNGTGRLFVDASGRVGVGFAPFVGASLSVSTNNTGSSQIYAIASDGTIQSDVTGTARLFYTAAKTAAASFTLVNLAHYDAEQGAFGAGSTVTNQFGFRVNNITGGTNNYGFYSSISSGTGRWNFYSNGTADSYFASNNFIWANGGSEKARIDSSGRLGLGTSSPGSLFTLGGSAPEIEFNDSANAADNKRWKLRCSSTSLIFQGFTDAGSGGGNNFRFNRTNENINSFQANSSGSGWFIVDNSTSRVGIGTTAPNTVLDLYRASATDVYITTGNTTATWLTGVATGGNYNIYSNNASSVVFSTNASERARIDSSGRLLVGTSSQIWGNRLEVVQTENNGNIGALRYTANTSGVEFNFIKSRGATAGTNTIVSNGDDLARINFKGADGSTYVDAARITAQVDGTPGANDMPGRLVFSTTADGASSPTARMTIKSTGIVNVGNAPTYADNTAALAGGLVAGDIYRKSDGTLMITY